MGNLIMDRTHQPSMTEITASISAPARGRWLHMNAFLAETFQSAPQVEYSVCAGQPGWNVKYKKGSKALCTLYPQQDDFIALVVLGQAQREVFELTREDYSGYTTALYDQCRLFNGTKWLMVRVSEEAVFEDVKRLVLLKTAARKRPRAPA